MLEQEWIDLRSDTVTKPTDKMCAAIAVADEAVFSSVGAFVLGPILRLQTDRPSGADSAFSTNRSNPSSSTN